MKDIGVRIAVFLATFGLAILGAKAQTNVTTAGGTVGTVPIFTGPSTIGNAADSVAIVLKHYAKWSQGRQERITKLFEAVYPGTYWAHEERTRN